MTSVQVGPARAARAALMIAATVLAGLACSHDDVRQTDRPPRTTQQRHDRGRAPERTPDISQPVEPSRPANPAPSEENMSDIVTSEKNRIQVLMAPERTRVELVERLPETSAQTLGALDAVAFETAEPVAYAAIYIFESQREHRAAVAELMKTVSPEGRRILHASNGRLLFFGHIRMDGPDPIKAKYRLSDLVGAFAGDE